MHAVDKPRVFLIKFIDFLYSSFYFPFINYYFGFINVRVKLMNIYTLFVSLFVLYTYSLSWTWNIWCVIFINDYNYNQCDRVGLFVWLFDFVITRVSFFYIVTYMMHRILLLLYKLVLSNTLHYRIFVYRW